MSQVSRFRKKVRKLEENQAWDAYRVLAGKVLLGLTLGCFVAMPSGIAYAEEPPAETEIKTKITAIDGQQSTIVKENDLYKIYAQFVSDDGLGVNRFKEFSLGNGDRADMYFIMKDSTNYANTLVNMVNSEVNINGVLNAVKNGKIDGNLYFLSPEGIVVGSQGVINAGSFTGMVVQKDTFNELFKGEKNKNKSGEEFGLDEITALMASDEDNKPATTGNIEVSGHINTHSGIVLGAGVIDINDGAQLKSISNIQFENVVNSEIAQQIPQGLTASQRTDGSGDIVLKAASFKNVDDSELPALKATKVKDKDEYELKNWDKWGEGWLKELFAADNTSSVTSKGKITTDGAVKISADANTSYKEGQIFEYLQDQRTKDLVQKKIRESIIKDAALRYGMYLYLKKTSGKDSEDLLKPDSSQWTKWIDLFLLGIMEGTGNRSNEASVSLGGTIDAESLEAKASANLTMDVNASVMARAYTNVTGKNTSEVTVNKGLELKQGEEKIDGVNLAADTNTTILATAKGLNVQRKEGDTTTKLPSVYGAVTIVNSESSANVKVNEEIDTAGEFKATASMQEDMEVTASSAMNEESGVLSAGVAYVNDKTSANVTINKDISASSIEISANNTVAKDLMKVNNTLGVMSGQIFDGDTQPVELKPLDSSQKSSLNKYFDKLVDYGDELVGKLKKYGDAGATVGIFKQENSSSVEINAALEAINGNDENGDNKGNININAETMIGGTDDDGNQIGGFHMNVVNSMTHAKSSDGSAATTGALINAAVLVDNVKNNATVKIANAKESNENDDDANDEIDEIGENPVASLYASGSININSQAHMDYNPAAEGLYNVKEAWKQVKESYEAITNLPQDIKDAYKAALENWDENVKAIDWSDPTKIPSTLSNWEKLKEAIDKVKEDGELGLDIKARLISTAENALNLTHPSTYTHYHVRTESKNQSEDGSGNFTATGSVQVNELQNNAAVLIGEETTIKADGNTGIKAESGTYTVTLTGKGGEYGTLDQSGKVGMGASVAHQEISGTGLVMVGKNTIIEGNAIDINGVNNMKQVDIVYSSGKADTLNIGGMVNIVKGTGNSIVSIDDEATLTATGKPDESDEGSNNGTINLHTENNTTINAITGGLTLGGQDAVGAVGIGVNYVDYNTNNIVQVADNGEGASDKADDTEENKAENRTTNRSVLARELAEKVGSVDDDFFGAATDFEAPIDAEDEILWQAAKLDVTATTTGTINSIGAEIAGTAGSDRTLFDKGSDLIQKLANKRDKFDNWLKGSKLTDTVNGSNESNKEADDKNLGGKGGFRLSAAGSAAINKGISDTAATVDGINIEKNEAANSSLTEVAVSATDNTFLGSFAGGAAYNALKKNESPSVAVGGAVGYVNAARTVDSLIMNTQIEGAVSVSNTAEKSGTEVASGLALGVNSSNGSNLTASGSVSYNNVNNNVRAMMLGTDVNKNSEGTTKTNITNTATASNWQLAGGLAANWTGSDGTSVNLGGSVSISDLSNNLVSMISGGEYKKIDAFYVEAAKSINHLNVAVAGSKGGGKSAIGLDGAVAYNEINNNVQAAVRNGTKIDASGDVSFIAHDKEIEKPKTDAKKEELKANGIDVNNITDKYVATAAKKTINNEAVVDENNNKEIKENTDNNANTTIPGSSLVLNVAAGINANGNGAGVGVGIDDIKNNLSVDIMGATLKGASIYTTTTNQTKIVGTAAGASIGSNYFGGAGGISWHNVTNNNKVNITDSSLSANAVSALADNKSSIVSVAGQFNASTNVGVGMTFANNDMNNTTGVYVKGGEIKLGANDSDGTLDLNAKNNTYVLAIGAGVGASKFNLNGAVAVNEGSNSSEAIISKGKKGTDIVNVKGLKVNAENTTSKTTIAGGLTISVGGVAGIGGGVAYANIGKKNQRETTQALIKDAVINAPKDNTAQMDVLANDKSRATTVGVGVGIEGSVNLQGGVARTNVYKDVNAGMENTSVNEKKAANQEVNSSAILNIKATSDINNKTAGAALATAFSGVLAGGVGLSFNDVDQNTKAFYNYLNTPAAQASNLYNLDINSTSNTKLLGIGIGLAGANTFAIGGSYSYNNIRGNTTAEMNKTNIISTNNIGVVAQSDDAISSIAGVIAGGAGGGFGVSVANNQITGDTLAAVKDSKLVTWTSDSETPAEFEKYKISVNNGMKSADKNKSDGIISGSVSRATFDPSLLKSARTNSKLSGLVVDSSSTHAIAADVLTGAGGAIGGVAGTFNENYISGNTKTSLNDTSVNEGADIDQYKNVSVKASDYNNIGSFEMGAAGGGNVGFGGNQNSNILGRSVLAESDSQKTTNVRAYNFDLQALSKQGISNLAVAGGLAVQGAALNANLIHDDLDMRVSAKVNNLNLAYEKNANVWAENESRIYMDTYGVSLSGIGVSAGFGINLLEQKNVVAASVSNSTLSDNDGSQLDDAVAEVKARNNTIQNAALLSGGVAGLGASLNGTVNYNKHTADVSVSVDKAKIESGEIKVSSSDTIKADYSNNAAQVGLLGGAGVNSAITTIADKSNINISNKSELSARKGVSLNAGIDRDIDTSMLNLSLGGVAAGVNHINTSINASITADKELQDKISTANAQDKNNTGSFVGMSASERQKSRERTAFKIDTNLKGTASGANLSVTGSSINAAGGMLHIDATEKNRLNLDAKGASVGLGAFVVTHATANVKNTANVNFDSATLYGQNVEILADTVDKQRDNNDKKPGIYTQGAVGTLGTKIAANAINSTVETSGTTGINVKNTHITTESDMKINANNAITANTNVYGVAAGTASVNAINTGITNTSAVAVNIENTDASKTYSINTTKSDGKININAIKTGNFTANSTGIAAGLASAGWNSTYVKDSSTSQINIKGKNYLFEADALSFQTANAPKLKTDIDNHAAAVVTGMASKATVEADSSALINVADDNFFSAGSVFFGAQVGKKDEITAASKLRSVAVAGMAVPGYSGDESNITTKTNAAINIGKEDYSYTINNNNNNANNNTENNSENEDNTRYATLTIDATNMTSRQNDISNVTVSGLKFAAGGIKGTTRAEDLASTTAGGGDVYKLVMGATGNSYTDSYVRGSGGGLMDYGTNAKAITYFDNSATANIYGKWFAKDNFYVNAKQFDSMDTQTFSASGGVLQGSGVYTSLNIGDKGRITSANIANGADITANKVYVGAENNINTNKNNKYSSRLDITAGNALGMSVLESKDVIKKGTQVNIGNNVKVTTVGTQEYEALNKDALKNYATGLNAGIAESIVVQSRTDYTSANKVTLGTGATLTSNGSYDVAGVTLAASDNIDSTVHAEGKVAGGAGAGPTAITEHKINRSNAVEVKGTIKSNKDINLYAGADNNGSKSNVKQLTIADAHNDTAIPLGWRRDLIVENRRNNSVQVESGAIGEALRNINIKAANGTENILKQASYHTIYGGEGGDGKAIPVVKTASDGNLNVDRFVNESTNYAKVDGSLLAGFQDKINVTITGQVVPKDLLGHNDIADVNDATKIVETHDVTAKGNNPSYTISIVDDEGRHYTELEKAAKQYTGSYANVLAERWNELNKLISAYNGEDGKGGDGQTAIAYAGYLAEMQLLEAKLNSLGLMEEKVVDGKTIKVPVTEGYDIPIVALPGLIEASGGTINVDTNNFYGKGSVVAKTNPEVKVENKSNAYLVVNDITIKDKGQGVIYRDNIIKSDANGKNQIKQLNSDKKYDVSYSKLKSGTEGNSGVNILSENPSLTGITLTDKVTKDGKITYVNNVFNGVGAIEIAGHVNAGTTDVTITNKNKTGGDIIINGSGTKATGIDGHSIRLTAQYGSVNQSYTKGVVNVGSTPQEVYKSANDAAINTIKNAYWLNNYTNKNHKEMEVDGSAAKMDSEKAATKSGRIAGSSIFIAADAINVNGILQSGYGKYTAVITEEQLNAAKTAAKNQDFSKSKLFEGRRIYMVNEGGTDWEAERASDGSLIYNVQVYYDPDNDTLLAEDIDAQGGKVYLAGRIISTTGGKIFAVDGGADISIDNQTNASMQLGKVLNNNINGEVTLTTISLDNNGKEVVTTKKYTTEGVTTSTGFNLGELNTTGAGRSYTFTPEANSRYNWTVGSESTTNTHYYYRDTSILHLDFATFESETGKAKKTVTVNDAKPLPNGIFVSTGTGPDYKIVADNVVLNNQRLNYNVTSKNKVLWKNYYYNWDVKTGSSQTYVSSIKADKPIDIKFIGQDSGTINLKSGGDITLNGNILNNNTEGTIAITSNKGALKANNGVSILGNKISLNAQKDIANINIETLDKETAVQLGAITRDGNIGINVTGNTEISTIEAKGTGDPMAGNNNVKLEVSGNIEQIAGEGIIGQRIDITSQSGGIGNLDQALKVHAGQQALNNDPLSASVNATAQKDIFLVQNTTGNNKDNDMRIGVIRSVAGDVTLTNEHGSFEDALPYTGEEASDETTARIQRWIDSGLIAGPDRNNAYIRKLEKNVSDYEHDVKESFADYEQMKALHDDLEAKYPDNYNEKWEENYSEEYRLAYESLRSEYEHYTDSDDYLNHLAADTNSDYAKLKAAAANPTYKWTQDELLYALRSEMINKEVGSTDSRDKIANISGKNVTLYGKNIGSNETPQSITFDQLKNGYSAGGKTNVDYLKILANSDASDVIRLKDENGKDYFRVTGTAPVGINATGTVTATATAEDISMSGRKATDDGAASVLKIGEVQAEKGFVRILGKEGIENALTDQTHTNVISGKDILLEGGEGAIGSENKPITVQAIGETTGDISARSNKNIYIKNNGLNPLSVGSIYTPDSVTLYAGNGLVGSKTSIDGVFPYINAQNLYLNGINGDSRSDLGTAERPLYVLGNSVNIQATGNSAHLKGVKYDPDNIVLGAIDMKEDFVLNTAGTVTVSNKAAAKKITLSGDKGIVMSETENEDTAESYINGTEEVNLKASEGDIGSKDNALRLLNNGGKISVAGANGYLIGLERSNLHTVDNMTLGAVGTEDSAGITGDLWVKSQGNLTTNEVINVGGALTLLANKNIDTKGILTSGGDVKVKASDIKLEKNVDTSGNINVDGKNITTEGTLTSNKAVNLTATENVQANGLTAGTDVAINAIAVTLSGEVGATNNIGITATGDISTTKAIAAGNNITATGDKITSSTWTATNGNITEDAVNITANGKLEAGKAVTLNGNESVNTKDAVNAGTDVTVNATTIELEKAVAAGGSIAAEGKNISAEGNLSATKAITLNGTGDVTTNETLVAGTDVAITATGEISTAKAITAGNNITLTGKDINSSGNWTASNGNITVEGKSIVNNDGLLSATKAVNLTATENVEVTDVSAGTDVAVKATTITLTGEVGASNNVGITATGDVTAKTVSAGNNLTVKGADINASGNWKATSGNISAEGKNITTNGQLSADKAVTLTGTEKVNTKESLTSGADVTVKAVTVELEKAVDAGGNIKATGKDITTGGQLSANNAVTLDATGAVAAKGLSAGTDVVVNGATVNLEDTVNATNNNVNITAIGDITSSAVITAGNNLTVKGADINASGNWKATSGNISAEGKNITTNGQLSADKAVTLTGTEKVNAKESLAAGADVAVKAVTVELEKAVDAGGNIKATGKDITTSDKLSAKKAITLTGTGDVAIKGDAVAGTDVAINAATVELSGDVDANNNVDITAIGYITTNNVITAGNNITATGGQVTSSEWAATNGNIRTDAVNITANGKLAAGKAITLNANETLNTKDTVKAGTDVTVNATTIQSEKAIEATENIKATGKNIITNGLSASKQVTLTADETVKTEGSVVAGTDVTVKAAEIRLENIVDAGENINANGTNISATGKLNADKAVTLTATDTVDVKELSAGTDVAVKATTINLAGEVGATNNVDITATRDVTADKAITAGKNLTVKGADIDASGNWTANNGNITAEGKNITTEGRLVASKLVTLNADNTVNTKGSIFADTNVTVKAAEIKLENTVNAGENINANGTNISASGKMTANKAVTLTATDTVDVNEVSAGTDAAVNATAIKLTGVVEANNNVDLTAAGDITTKAVSAGKDLTVKGTEITATGDWKARTGNITADADNITVDGKLEAGKGITLTADETLDAKGGMKSGTNATVTADTIKLNGAVEATDNIELEAARTITSTGDWTTTNGNITADGKQITAQGNISSGKDLKLNTSDGDMNITGNIAAKENVIASTENGALTVIGKASTENGSVTMLTGFDEYNNTNASITVTDGISAGKDVYAYSQNADIVVADLGSNVNAIEAGRDISVKTSGAGNIVLLGSLNAINNIEAELIDHDGDITVGNINDSDPESITAGNNVKLSTNVGTIYIYGHTQAINGDVSMKAANETYNPDAEESNFVIKERGSVEAGKNISLTGRNGDISIENYLEAKGGLQAKIEGQGNLSFGTDIEVTNDIELSTEKGNVDVGKKVKSTDGNISITTGQGAIYVGSQGATEDAIAAKENINLETKAGKVTVQGHTHSINGDVTVSAYAPEYQAGESSVIIEQNGKVISDGGGVTINSGNGDFHITDTVNANTTLTVNTVNKGSMYFDRDIEVTGDVNAKVDEGDVYIGHSVRSTGGNINISVGNGNIDVGDNDADVETITANQNINIETGIGKITVYGKTSTQEGDISLSAGSEAYVPGEDGLNIIIDHNGLVDSARDVKLTTRNGDLHITENIISKRSTDANVPSKGSIYFDKDMVSEGDLVTEIDEGSIYTRDMKAKGDVIVSIKKGDLVLNSAEGNHVAILLGDNTDASRVNTIRAKANGDGSADVVLSGKYVQIGTVENTGGSGSPLTMTVETPDGQNLVETFNIDKLISNTGTKVSKLWTNNGYVNVDKGAVDFDDALVGSKFTVNNSVTNFAIYGRTPTHDGEQLVYWNDVNKLYRMGRRYQFFEDGGIITDNAHLVEAHGWRQLRSNKYTETYSVVDMMRNNLMRKEHYYKEVPLSMFIPKAPRQWVEGSGEIVNSPNTPNASEEEITIE